jgi:hypothetical protein
MLKIKTSATYLTEASEIKLLDTNKKRNLQLTNRVAEIKV